MLSPSHEVDATVNFERATLARCSRHAQLRARSKYPNLLSPVGPS
jgi:hypothetical protein